MYDTGAVVVLSTKSEMPPSDGGQVLCDPLVATAAVAQPIGAEDRLGSNEPMPRGRKRHTSIGSHRRNALSADPIPANCALGSTDHMPDDAGGQSADGDLGSRAACVENIPANAPLSASVDMPVGATGQSLDASPVGAARRAKNTEANGTMQAKLAVPRGDAGHDDSVHREEHAGVAENIGATHELDAIHAMPQGGEGQATSDSQKLGELSATISELIALQRQRRFCIVSQQRCDRATESFIATQLGFSRDADAKERKAIYTKAAAFRKEVEKRGQSSGDDLDSDALAAAVPVILLSFGARESWDKHRAQVEKRMRLLARTLPCWPFAEKVSGLGDKGVAIIVGECGDLSNYATKERVWKRLGLAVIEGERQGRRSSAEEAAKHGYSPKRRSEIWNVADSLFKHQWRGAKDDAPAHPIGRYGEVYAARKAHTENREGWTPGHRDNDARRVMTKALIEDLWKAWRA